jgi:hypothetical protein
MVNISLKKTTETHSVGTASRLKMVQQNARLYHLYLSGFERVRREIFKINLPAQPAI